MRGGTYSNKNKTHFFGKKFDIFKLNIGVFVSETGFVKVGQIFMLLVTIKQAKSLRTFQIVPNCIYQQLKNWAH